MNKERSVLRMIHEVDIEQEGEVSFCPIRLYQRIGRKILIVRSEIYKEILVDAERSLCVSVIAVAVVFLTVIPVKAFMMDETVDVNKNIMSMQEDNNGEISKISDTDSASDITLEYDDVYDTGLSSISYISDQSVKSYQVQNGEKTDLHDSAVLTDCGNGFVRVIGTGTAKIVGTDQNGNRKTISVTAVPATLTVMFLNGQSNAEGMISLGQFSGAAGESVACDDGEVYSTYVSPYVGNKYSNLYPGIYMSQLISGSDSLPYSVDPDIASRMPSSLSSYDTNMKGDALAYDLNALTESGNGKTGPDAGLAYEWNMLTGDKVWVINTAYSGSSITKWQEGETGLTLTEKTAAYADEILEAETEAGHYKMNKRLDVWMQGETDTMQTTDWYLERLTYTEQKLTAVLELDYFGIVTARRFDATDPTSSVNISVTGFKNADYIYTGLHTDSAGIVSNVNELWVTDSDVRNYFTSSVLTYPTQGDSLTAPTTTASLHGDEHFSQIAHNENGISAAKGLYAALYGRISDKNDADKDTGFWMSMNGTAITSLNAYTNVPTGLRFRAGCSTDDITYSAGSGRVSYDPVYGTVTVTKSGNYRLTAYNHTTGRSYTIRLSISDASDGLHKIMYTITDRKWYCIKNGQIHANDVVKNDAGWWYVDENGTVDFTYNGFADNKNGTWYIRNGKVNFAANGVLKGIYHGTVKWGNIKNGQLQKTETVARNAYGWWYIGPDGFVDFTANTIAKNIYGWWYIDGTGRVDFTFTGIAANRYGRWYCKNGKVQFDYTGKVFYKGKAYRIKYGKVV